VAPATVTSSRPQADRPISYVDLTGSSVAVAPTSAGKANCFELVGSDGKVFFVACRVRYRAAPRAA